MKKMEKQGVGGAEEREMICEEVGVGGAEVEDKDAERFCSQSGLGSPVTKLPCIPLYEIAVAVRYDRTI